MSVEIIIYGDINKGAKESVENANIELLIRVTAQAKALCPVKSGILRSSIMWKVPGQEGGHEKGLKVSEKVGEGEGLVGTATEYAQYVEFGTRYMDAQAYLRPAVLLEVFGPRGQNTMKKETVEAIKKSLNLGKRNLK